MCISVANRANSIEVVAVHFGANAFIIVLCLLCLWIAVSELNANRFCTRRIRPISNSARAHSQHQLLCEQSLRCFLLHTWGALLLLCFMAWNFKQTLFSVGRCTEWNWV